MRQHRMLPPSNSKPNIPPPDQEGDFSLMPDPTSRFIADHRNDDVRQLALGKKPPGVDSAFALEQIAGWQTARTKLPTWASTEGIVYPPHLSLEQCSSEMTAHYKARLCQRLLGGAPTQGTAFADITGGMGVDFSFLAPLFERSYYIERLPHLCACARHNFPLLGLENAEVMEADGIEALDRLPHLRLLFVDPARRDSHGARTFSISDCTPDLLPLLPRLLDKADLVVAKLSPMLDWHHTAVSLDAASTGAVKEIHIVATGNECKELLVVLSADAPTGPTTLHCANDNCLFTTDIETERQAPAPPFVADFAEAATAIWLYEPNAAIMKAGCFGTLAMQWPLKALAANSHLFVGDRHFADFPGRQLRIQSICTLNKRQLKATLAGITHANITTRNFPMSAAELRKRLRLVDGGAHHILASTIGKCEHVLFVCTKT